MNSSETTIWGGKNPPLLRHFLSFANGIPSHNKICDPFAAIDPELLKPASWPGLAWIDELRDPSLPKLVAVDGKTLQQTHDRGTGRKPLELVFAWAAGQRLVLEQHATEAKFN